MVIAMTLGRFLVRPAARRAPALIGAIVLALAVSLFSVAMLLTGGHRAPVSTPQPLPGACAPFCGSAQ